MYISSTTCECAGHDAHRAIHVVVLPFPAPYHAPLYSNPFLHLFPQVFPQCAVMSPRRPVSTRTGGTSGLPHSSKIVWGYSQSWPGVSNPKINTVCMPLTKNCSCAEMSLRQLVSTRMLDTSAHSRLIQNLLTWQRRLTAQSSGTASLPCLQTWASNPKVSTRAGALAALAASETAADAAPAAKAASK